MSDQVDGGDSAARPDYQPRTGMALLRRAKSQGRLLVSEVFGPTIQGEGRSIGRPAMFLRLGGCNLACDWCDTTYSWNHELHDLEGELRAMTPTEVSKAAFKSRAGRLVVTGGEPLLQAQTLRSVLEYGHQEGWQIEIETNGSVEPQGLEGLVDLYTVSPKLSNSGQDPSRALNWTTLMLFAQSDRAAFKFVCRSPADLSEVETIVERAGIHPEDVIVMPEGTTVGVLEDRLRKLAEPVIARGWSLSPRLHIQLWGDCRGR